MIIKCYLCDEEKARSSFENSRLEKNDFRCRDCETQRHRKNQNTIKRLITTYRKQISAYNKKNNPNGIPIRVETINRWVDKKNVQAIYDECNGGSVISGDCEGKDLSLFRYWRDDEPAPWNYVLVSLSESKSLASMKDPSQMHQKFPIPIRREMIVRRCLERRKKKKQDAISSDSV